MKALKAKWISLFIALFLALSIAFSATVAVAKAGEIEGGQGYASQDVSVYADDMFVEADRTYSFTVYAYSEKGFSSYSLSFELPDFMAIIEEPQSDLYGFNSVFEQDTNSYGGNITYSSANMQYGRTALFTVQVAVAEYANGYNGVIDLYSAEFTDVYGNILNVNTQNASVYVQGEYARMKGDFDGNGMVEIKDVMYMQRYMLGKYTRAVSETDINAADINNDGRIDIVDCQYIQSYLADIIYSLDDIGGGHYEPIKVYGTYFNGGDSLILKEDGTYEWYINDYEYDGYFHNEGYTVYLVKDYELDIAVIDTDNKIFYVDVSYAFDEETNPNDGYISRISNVLAYEYYGVEGKKNETISVAANGAFVRNCYEDDIFTQYNGMLNIYNVDENYAYGEAYVFSMDASAPMTIEITVDMSKRVISYMGGGDENYRTIAIYVNGILQFTKEVKEGTPYCDFYNNFINTDGNLLINNYGAIDFNDCSTNSGIYVFSDEKIYSDDVIYLNASDNLPNIYKIAFVLENKTLGDSNYYYLSFKKGTTYSEVYNAFLEKYGKEVSLLIKDVIPTTQSGKNVSDDTSVVDGEDIFYFIYETVIDESKVIYIMDLRTADGFTISTPPTIYYGSAENVLRQLNRYTYAIIYKAYKVDNNPIRLDNGTEVSFSVDMLDVSGIDFSDYNKNSLVIPANVPYGDKTVSTTLEVYLIPNLNADDCFLECTTEKQFIMSSFDYLRFYSDGENSGWVACCINGAGTIAYLRYTAETYDGTAVYLMRPSIYMPMNICFIVNMSEGGAVLSNYRCGEEDDYTEYHLNFEGDNVILKLFNGSYAELLFEDEGKTYYEGTIKMVIDGNTATLLGATYTVEEREDGNYLVMSAYDGVLVGAAYYNGQTINLYEDGVADFVVNGEVFYRGTWNYQSEEQTCILIYNGMSPQAFFKWNVDGVFYTYLEPYLSDEDALYGEYSYNGETVVIYYVLLTGYNYDGSMYSSSQILIRFGNDVFKLGYIKDDFILEIYGMNDNEYYYIDENNNLIIVESYYAYKGTDKYELYLNEEIAISPIGGYGFFVYSYSVSDGVYSFVYNGETVFTCEFKNQSFNVITTNFDVLKNVNSGNGEEKYDLYVYIMSKDGKQMGYQEFTVNSLNEFYEIIKGMNVIDVYVNEQMTEKLSYDNFGSGVIYVKVNAGSTSGEEQNVYYEITVYYAVDGLSYEHENMTVKSYDECISRIGNKIISMADGRVAVYQGTYLDTSRKTPVNPDNFTSGDIYAFYYVRG